MVPFRSLTIEDYLRLGETECGYTELVEGRLVIAQNPGARHHVVCHRLADQLERQLPGTLQAIYGVDVDLELAPPGGPGSSLRPDLVIVDEQARLRVRTEGGMPRAREVRVVVEVASEDSRRTDTVSKRSEYADAGIPHYWVVDLASPVSLLACPQGAEVTGVFTTDAPFPITIDLDRLD